MLARLGIGETPVPAPLPCMGAESANALIARTLAAAAIINWLLGFGILGFI